MTLIRATAEQNSCAQHFALVLLQMQINMYIACFTAYRLSKVTTISLSNSEMTTLSLSLCESMSVSVSASVSVSVSARVRVFHLPVDSCWYAEQLADHTASSSTEWNEARLYELYMIEIQLWECHVQSNCQRYTQYEIDIFREQFQTKSIVGNIIMNR